MWGAHCPVQETLWSEQRKGVDQPHETVAKGADSGSRWRNLEARLLEVRLLGAGE